MAIKVTGLNKTLQGLQKGIGGYAKRAKGATMKAGLKAEALVKKKTPVDTGNLRSSINTRQVSQGRDKTEVVVGTNVSYAPHVEFGTKKMKPRSMFRRTIDEDGKDIQQTFTKHLKK